MRPRSLSAFASLILCAPLFIAACTDDPAATTTTTTSGAGGGGGEGVGGGGGAGALCEPATNACSDDIILQMDLQEDIAPGKVENAPEGAGFISTIDARAGGFGAADPDSYVHARFTDKGLEKVDISDQDSLDSMDWDISFRRFVIRINSVDSGPSCVTAARVPGSVAFDDIKTLPDNLTFKADSYFTESCELIPDGSGLGSPATVLSSYWIYPGCVKMTGHIYVVKLRDGRHVKLTVLSYYSEATQAECDACMMDSCMITPTGSAIFRVRWEFLP